MQVEIARARIRCGRDDRRNARIENEGAHEILDEGRVIRIGHDAAARRGEAVLRRIDLGIGRDQFGFVGREHRQVLRIVLIVLVADDRLHRRIRGGDRVGLFHLELQIEGVVLLLGQAEEVRAGPLPEYGVGDAAQEVADAVGIAVVTGEDAIDGAVVILQDAVREHAQIGVLVEVRVDEGGVLRHGVAAGYGRGVAGEEAVGDGGVDVDVVARQQRHRARLRAVVRAIGEADTGRADRSRAEVPVGGQGDVAAVDVLVRIDQVDLRTQVDIGAAERHAGGGEALDEVDQGILIEVDMVLVRRIGAEHLAGGQRMIGRGRVGDRIAVLVGAGKAGARGVEPAGGVDDAVEVGGAGSLVVIVGAPHGEGVQHDTVAGIGALGRAVEGHVDGVVGQQRGAQVDFAAIVVDAVAAGAARDVEHRALRHIDGAGGLDVLIAVGAVQRAIAGARGAQLDGAALLHQRGGAVAAGRIGFVVGGVGRFQCCA